VVVWSDDGGDACESVLASLSRVEVGGGGMVEADDERTLVLPDVKVGPENS
jgi:hypothetical protein